MTTALAKRADIVGISLDSKTQPRPHQGDLYHCKYLAAKHQARRINDMYVVCGQAQRSIMWPPTKNAPGSSLTSLSGTPSRKRLRPTRFEIGSKDRLEQIRDQPRARAVALRVYIVQPGLSKAGAAEHQLALRWASPNGSCPRPYQVPSSTAARPSHHALVSPAIEVRRVECFNES